MQDIHQEILKEILLNILLNNISDELLGSAEFGLLIQNGWVDMDKIQSYSGHNPENHCFLTDLGKKELVKLFK